MDGGMMAKFYDLVLVTLPGVQGFLVESRTTADLHSASRIISQLTAAMRAVAQTHGKIVFPSLPAGSTAAEPSGVSAEPHRDASAGLPNRVVVLVTADAGEDVASAMAEAAQGAWRAMLARLPSRLRNNDSDTPGFPEVHWVVIPGTTESTYAEQWKQAVSALVARKRTRTFPPYQTQSRPVCTLSARWASAGADQRSGEQLSVVAHVKRSYRQVTGEGFPSTLSLASADYRDRVIARAVDDEAVCGATNALKEAVARLTTEYPEIRRGSSDLPGLRAKSPSAVLRWLSDVEGAWCYPDVWDPPSLRRDHKLGALPDHDVCEHGRGAAHRLIKAASEAGIRPPTSYLAAIAQDADRMGVAMSHPPGGTTNVTDWHGLVSAALVDVGQEQIATAESPGFLGRAVYAGGDDLLCFVPVSSALTAATVLNDVFIRRMHEYLPTVTASTAVTFFHATTPLQFVVRSTQELLADAKRRGRPGVGVAVLRRGGERARMVLPWAQTLPGIDGRPTTLSLLSALTDAYTRGLSPRLAARLEGDRDALASLPADWRAREIRRLMGRHNASDEVTALLAALTEVEPGACPTDRFHDRHGQAATAETPNAATDLALVARFVAAETVRGTR